MYLYNNIVKDGNKVLRTKCSEISLPLNDETLNVLSDMHKYLVNGYDEEFCKNNDIHPGVGLAAPQVGIDKRMVCVLAYDEKGDLHEYNMINPKIISYSLDMTYLESGEGCLSVEENYKGYIHRHRKIKVSTYLYDFVTNELYKTTLQLKGYIAIVCQHELDHLDGILYYDHINKADPFFIPENSTPVKFK